VRHRTVRSKGCLSNHAALAMVFKLVEAAQKNWRRLDGNNQLPKLILGVKFADGTEVVTKPANRQRTTVAACGLVYVIVTDANALAGKIHNRKPVVLDDADVRRWRSASATGDVRLTGRADDRDVKEARMTDAGNFHSCADF
jgi:hypothetical protein